MSGNINDTQQLNPGDITTGRSFVKKEYHTDGRTAFQYTFKPLQKDLMVSLFLGYVSAKTPWAADPEKMLNELGFYRRDEEQPNPAVAAIQYALTHPFEDPIQFLRCWNEGDFQALREEWDGVPEEVFIGADTQHPDTEI